MNARYYVPNTNRWLSPDTIVPNPANPQSFNRYSYVNNNPLNFTDPTGHCASGYADAEYDDYECWQYAYQMQDKFGIDIDFLGEFSLPELLLIVEALNKVNDNLGEDIQLELINHLNHYAGDSEFLNNLREGSWDVIGFHIGGGGIVGIGASFGIDFVFNFESLEFSTMVGGGLMGGFGLSVGFEAYAFFGYNMPSNSSLSGGYYAVNISGAVGPVSAGGFVTHSGIDLPSAGDPWALAVGWAPGYGATANGEVGYSAEVFRMILNVENPGQSLYTQSAPIEYYIATWLNSWFSN